MQLQEAVNELIASQKYDDRDDFTVVIQPFFIGVELPEKVNSHIVIIAECIINCTVVSS